MKRLNSGAVKTSNIELSLQRERNFHVSLDRGPNRPNMLSVELRMVSMWLQNQPKRHRTGSDLGCRGQYRAQACPQSSPSLRKVVLQLPKAAARWFKIEQRRSRRCLRSLHSSLERPIVTHLTQLSVNFSHNLARHCSFYHPHPHMCALASM